MSTLGERIRRIRGSESQSQFSAKLGIPQTTLSRYERGASTPDLDFLIKLSDMSCCCIEWLITGRGSMTGFSHQGKDDIGQAIDTARLTEAIKAVEQGLLETKRVMTSDKKAELISAIYDFLSEKKEKNTKKVINIIKAIS